MLSLTAAQTQAAPLGAPIVYKDADCLELKLYVNDPPNWKPTQQFPALVFFHGGGWVNGSPDEFNPEARYFAARGMVTILVEYRLLKPKTLTPPIVCIEDAQSAMRWVRCHAEQLGIDSHRIAAGGSSAGGQLAAYLGLMHGFDAAGDDLAVSPKPNALVLYCPAFNNGPDHWGYHKVGERYKEFSPAHNVGFDAPPTVIFGGTKDDIIEPEAIRAFQRDMDLHGAWCETFLFEGQAHEFFENEPWQSLTLHETDNFFVSLGWLSKQGAKPE